VCCADVPEPLAALLLRTLRRKPAARLQSAAEFTRRLREIESSAGQPSPDGPNFDADTSDSPPLAAPNSLPLTLRREEAVSAPSETGLPARNIGLVVDSATDLSAEDALLREEAGPQVDGITSAAATRGTTVALEQPPFHSSLTNSLGRVERADARTAAALRRAPRSGPPSARSRLLFAYAIPAVIVLVLVAAASSWLAAKRTLPIPAPLPSQQAVTHAPDTASPLQAQDTPDAVAVGGPEALLTADLSEEAGRPPDVRRESHLPEETRAGKGPATVEGENSAQTKAPVKREPSTPTPSQVGPDVVAGPSTPEEKDTGDDGCTISTSKGALTLRGNGGSAEIAVSLDRATASAAVTATTDDWSNIVVFAAHPGTRGAGLTTYRITSVSQRVGTYAVIFNSPCGAKRVAVTVD